MSKTHNKIRVVVIALLVLTAGVFVYLLVKGKQNNSIAKSITGQAVVTITDQGFSPSTIKVKKGTQVTFTNLDTKLHRVASDPYPTHSTLPGFDSVEPLNVNDSYSYIFEKSGTFTYQDYLNPYKIKGTVIVE